MERPTTISPFHPFPDRCGGTKQSSGMVKEILFEQLKTASDSLSF